MHYLSFNLTLEICFATCHCTSLLRVCWHGNRYCDRFLILFAAQVDVLKALGAEIIRTPTEAAWDSPESRTLLEFVSQFAHR